MILQSDGLGKTELEAEVVDIKKVDDLVIFSANTTRPVKWRLRMGFQERDFRDLIWAVLRPRNLLFIINALICSALSGLFSSRKEIQGTENLLEKEAK